MIDKASLEGLNKVINLVTKNTFDQKLKEYLEISLELSSKDDLVKISVNKENVTIQSIATGCTKEIIKLNTKNIEEKFTSKFDLVHRTVTAQIKALREAVDIPKHENIEEELISLLDKLCSENSSTSCRWSIGTIRKVWTLKGLSISYYIGKRTWGISPYSYYNTKKASIPTIINEITRVLPKSIKDMGIPLSKDILAIINRREKQLDKRKKETKILDGILTTIGFSKRSAYNDLIYEHTKPLIKNGTRISQRYITIHQDNKSFYVGCRHLGIKACGPLSFLKRLILAWPELEAKYIEALNTVTSTT